MICNIGYKIKKGIGYRKPVPFLHPCRYTSAKIAPLLLLTCNKCNHITRQSTDSPFSGNIILLFLNR